MNADSVNCKGTGDNGIDENNVQSLENDERNDCENSCRAAITGAIPKIKNLTCDIPSIPEDVTKINNNACHSNATPSENSCDATLPVADTAANCSEFNSLHDRCNGADLYGRNGNTSVEKIPSINGSIATGSQKYVNGNCSFQNRLQNSGNLGYNVTANRLIPQVDSYLSSDEGNDDDDDEHSSDEFCVYTYKGDQAADLPHSFFSLDTQDGGRDNGRHDNREQNGRNADRNSSPEMDYLEMDFDPGPSCDIDSDLDDNDSIADLHLEAVNNYQITVDYSSKVPSTLNIFESTSHNVPNGDVNCAVNGTNKPCTSSSTSNSDTPVEIVCSPSSPPLVVNLPRRHTIPCENKRICHRSRDFHTPDETSNITGDFANLYNESCNYCKPDDRHVFPLSSQNYAVEKQTAYDKKIIFPNMATTEDSTTDGAKALPERIMIWSEQEVYIKQILQITDPSSSGATAVCNALTALNIPLCIDDVIDAMRIRLRSEVSNIPKYLFSRSCEGSSHEDIIRGLEVASNKTVFARFFPFYPERNVCLTQWLGSWMQKGAIPIITVNLQRGLNKSYVMPDLWHHQMVFGIGPYELYLTNPLEHITEDALWPQITSPPVLLIRRHDVLSRWQPNVDLEPLMCHADSRWQTMNVLGQVVNMLRETLSATQGGSITQHLKIPAYYTAGITLAIRRESPAFVELRDAPDLPLIQSKFHTDHYHQI